MAITLKTITGKVVIPGTTTGIRAKVTATPMTNAQALTFPDDNVLTWGPVEGYTDASGMLPATFKIPTSSAQQAELLWKFVAEPVDKHTALPKSWTMGEYQITGTGTIDLADLVDVDVLGINTATYVTIQNYVASAQAAATSAAAASTAAAASASLANTLVTSDLGTTDGQSFALASDPNSQTGGWLRDHFVAPTIMRGDDIDPTGATDSTTAMQAIITTAGAGASIFFPYGATFTAAGLSPLDGQEWWGGGTIKRPNASTANILTGTDIDRFTLHGITIDGNKSGATATSNSGAYFTRFTNASIHDAQFVNMPTNNPALELRGGVSNKVVDNLFANVGYGVIVGLAYGSTDDCAGNSINDNTFDGVDLNPIFVTENIGSVAGTVTGLVFDTTVVGNTIRNWGDAGIEIGSGCRGATIVGNTLDNAGAGGGVGSGVLIRDAHDVTVVGNTIRDLGGVGTACDGISVTGLNDDSARIHIAGNSVRNCTRYGIFINGAPPDSTPGENTVTGSGVQDVFVVASPWNAVTYQNSWADNTFGYDQASYKRGPGGTVRLRGMTTAGASGTTAFTLPVGFRPTGPLIFPVVSNGSPGHITVNADGTVVMTSVTSASWVSLFGITFTTN